MDILDTSWLSAYATSAFSYPLAFYVRQDWHMTTPFRLILRRILAIPGLPGIERQVVRESLRPSSEYC